MAILALDPTTVNHVSRERVLVRSRSGQRLCVAEVYELEGELEVFQVSGYFSCQPEAERCLSLLDGHWLSEGTRQRLREGRMLRLNELEWES